MISDDKTVRDNHIPDREPLAVTPTENDVESDHLVRTHAKNLISNFY